MIYISLLFFCVFILKNVDFEALLGRDYPSTTSDVYYDVDEYIEFVHELASSLHGRAGVYTDVCGKREGEVASILLFIHFNVVKGLEEGI